MEVDNNSLQVGRPLYWNLETHIKSIIQMIQSDELEIALRMCDQVPSFYRTKDHYPKELADIKKRLYQQCYDIFLYGNDDDEANQAYETCKEQWFGQYCYPRAEIITTEIVRLNSAGITPWVFDLSCSHGNCGVGLKETIGLKFNYLGKSMNHRAAKKVQEWLGDIWADKPLPGQHTILVCTEALEHAWDSEDIVRAAYKVGVDFDQIFLSTPLNTLGGGLENWDTRPLGHVRCYNEMDFLEFAGKAFPNYKWALFKSHSQVLHGQR